MSEYSALGEVSRLLKERCLQAFKAEPQLDQLFSGTHVVSLETPKEMASAPAKVGLSVWLYQIERNEFLTNRLPQRPDPTHLSQVPVAVNLHYLITPISADPETEQLIMGKVFEVLHESPFIPPDPTHPELDDQVRVSLENPNLEILSRVWTALQEPYRLCTSYLVQVVNIGSRVPVESSPVLTTVTTYDQIMRES